MPPCSPENARSEKSYPLPSALLPSLCASAPICAHLRLALLFKHKLFFVKIFDKRVTTSRGVLRRSGNGYFPLPSRVETATLQRFQQNDLSEVQDTMKREKLHYNTVREVCFAPEDIVQLSDALQENGAPCHLRHLMPGEPDPVRLAQVKDVIETVMTGRKYEVLLLRSQGKTFAEIALLLEISKSAVQSHYRLAIRRVQQALGIDPAKKAKPPSPSPHLVV